MKLTLLTAAALFTATLAAVVNDPSSVGPLSPEKDPRTSLEESIRRMRLSVDRELVYLARMDEMRRSTDTAGMVARQVYPADEETDSTFGGFNDKVNDGTDVFRPVRPGVDVPSARQFEQPEPSDVPIDNGPDETPNGPEDPDDPEESEPPIKPGNGNKPKPGNGDKPKPGNGNKPKPGNGNKPKPGKPRPGKPRPPTTDVEETGDPGPDFTTLPVPITVTPAASAVAVPFPDTPSPEPLPFEPTDAPGAVPSPDSEPPTFVPRPLPGGGVPTDATLAPTSEIGSGNTDETPAPTADLVTPTEINSTEPTTSPEPTIINPGFGGVGFEPSTSPEVTDDASTTDEAGEDDDDVCFPADATVQLEDGRVKSMSEVELGDRVLVGNGEYSAVFLFTHKMASVRHSFVELLTSSGNRLALTKGHYLYVNGKLAAASTVRKGDMLVLGGEALATVENVRTIVSTGLYNPQTVQGDIIVNGVRASTYTLSVEPKMAHALLAPLRAVYERAGFSLSAFDMGAGYLASLVPSGSLVN